MFRGAEIYIIHFRSVLGLILVSLPHVRHALQTEASVRVSNQMLEPPQFALF